MEPHVTLGSGLTTRSLQEVSTAMFVSGCMTGCSSSWLDIAALLIRSTTKQTTSRAVIAEVAALYYGQQQFDAPTLTHDQTTMLSA